MSMAANNNGNKVEERGPGKQRAQPPPAGGNIVPPSMQQLPKRNPLPPPAIESSRCITIKLRLPRAPGTAGLVLRDDSASGLPVLVGLHPSQGQVPRGMIDEYCIIGIRDMERGRAIETRTGELLRWWMGAFQSMRGEVEVEMVFYPLAALGGGRCKGGTNRPLPLAASLADGEMPPGHDAKEGPIHGELTVVDTNDAEGMSGVEEASVDFHCDQTTKTDEVSNDAATSNGEAGDGGKKANASENVSSDESLDENPHNHTQEELDRIDAIERESLELFPPGRRDISYENPRDLVARYRETIANRYGFKVQQSGSAVVCSRAELSARRKRYCDAARAKVPEDRRRVRRNVRCGCTFKFTFSYVTKPLKGGGGGAGKYPVFVSRTSYRHTHGCSGLQPAILTMEQMRRMEAEAQGHPWKARPARDGLKTQTWMAEHFRPMFRVLAKHPRQKAFLAVLEGVKNLIEGNDAPVSDAASASGTLSNAKGEEEDEVEQEGGQEQS